MTGTDKYLLGRDYRASAHLTAQHHLWEETFGYQLHPSIPRSQLDSSGLTIADIGTGTGIFLLDLEQRRRLTPQAQYIGLDISTAQFPRPE